MPVYAVAADILSRLSRPPLEVHVKWSGWRDSHPRPPGSRPGRLLLTLHPGKWRFRWDLHPHSARRQRVAFLFSYRSKWWETLVTLQFVTSSFVLRHPIYSRATGSLPGKLVARVGVAPTSMSL